MTLQCRDGGKLRSLEITKHLLLYIYTYIEKRNKCSAAVVISTSAGAAKTAGDNLAVPRDKFTVQSQCRAQTREKRWPLPKSTQGFSVPSRPGTMSAPLLWCACFFSFKGHFNRIKLRNKKRKGAKALISNQMSRCAVRPPFRLQKPFLSNACHRQNG